MKTKEIERGGGEEIGSTSEENNKDSLPISLPEKLSYTKDNNK